MSEAMPRAQPAHAAAAPAAFWLWADDAGLPSHLEGPVVDGHGLLEVLEPLAGLEVVHHTQAGSHMMHGTTHHQQLGPRAQWTHGSK